MAWLGIDLETFPHNFNHADKLLRRSILLLIWIQSWPYSMHLKCRGIFSFSKSWWDLLDSFPTVLSSFLWNHGFKVDDFLGLESYLVQMSFKSSFKLKTWDPRPTANNTFSLMRTWFSSSSSSSRSCRSIKENGKLQGEHGHLVYSIE